MRSGRESIQAKEKLRKKCVCLALLQAEVNIAGYVFLAWLKHKGPTPHTYSPPWPCVHKITPAYGHRVSPTE